MAERCFAVICVRALSGFQTNGKRIYYAKVKYYNIVEEAISIVDDKEITSVNVRHFIKG